MEFFQNFAQQIKAFYQNLTQQQRVLFAVVVAAAIISVVGIFAFSGPTYGTLYSNLSPQDANQIVKKLQEKSIKYKLESEGTTILVPDDKIYDLRLALAGEGIPNSSIVGYEIFDRSNLGVSDQTQRLNRQRALEGELTRTILQIQNVDAARVHIVVPENRLFREDQKPATASVWLRMKGGAQLSAEAAQGVQHLVASSIEGLESGNVRIFDQRGILRSISRQGNSLAGAIANNLDIQHDAELALTRKVQGMLDAVMGPGNSYVEVNVDFDFRQVNKTEEKFDPEDQVVRSEQITDQISTSADTSRANAKNITQKSNSTVTNYEIGKTVESSVSHGGDVKRVSVSVVVNGRYEDSLDENRVIVLDEDELPIRVYHSLTDKELNDISEIVKKQVGFSSERNDQIAVVNMQFMVDKELMVKELSKSLWQWYMEQLYNPTAWLMVIFMLLSVLLLYRMASRIKFNRELETAVALQEATKKAKIKPAAVPASGIVEAGTPASAAMEAARLAVTQAEELGEEELRAQDETREKVKLYFRDKPEEAASLLKVWLAENQ
jgi:flagellar M-ring protein FliF